MGRGLDVDDGVGEGDGLGEAGGCGVRMVRLGAEMGRKGGGKEACRGILIFLLLLLSGFEIG